jgi:hypothetical protein
MKSASGRVRSLPWFIVAAFFSAIVAAPVTAAAKPAAAKPAAKKSAAKKSAGKSGSAKSGSSSSTESKPVTPYEVPSPGGSETPPGSASSSAGTSETSGSSSSSTPSATESSPKPAETRAEPAKEPSKDEPAPDLLKDVVSSAEPSPPPAPEPIVVPEPVPLFVANVGPSTYPGKLRGIRGGSLWLEPSFHGLQWPQMSKSGVGVSGLFWLDSGYLNLTRDNDSLPDTATPFQQGRGVLRVTPTYTDGRFFAQGQVELVGNVCQATTTVCIDHGTFDTDDLWVRFGVWNSWDVQVGRFRGWELYHTGMGLDLYTFERLGAHQLGLQMPTGLDLPLNAPDIYGVTYLYDRPSDGLGSGYLAFHAYPSNTVRFEMLGKVGVSELAAGTSHYGARPAFILDQGWLKLKVGAEYEKATQATPGKQGNVKVERERWGVGAALQFVIDPRAEFGANFAYGSQSTIDDGNNMSALFNSYKRSSVGGFGNVRLGDPWILGAGVNFTWQNDKFYALESQSPNYTAQLQAFGALQYMVAEQLYIKAVISYARADFVTSDASLDLWSNSLISGRIRLMYLY